VVGALSPDSRVILFQRNVLLINGAENTLNLKNGYYRKKADFGGMPDKVKKSEV
jgi:hypothetical protein